MSFVVKISRQNKPVEFVQSHNSITGLTQTVSTVEEAQKFDDWFDAEELVDGVFPHPTPKWVTIEPTGGK